jgi:peroxiredoxin
MRMPKASLAVVFAFALGLVSAAGAGEPAPAPPPAAASGATAPGGAGAAGAAAAPSTISGPRAGEKAPAFSLKAVDSGQPRALESFTKAKGKDGKEGKGAVVLFLSCRCPYVAQARSPLAELHKQYGDKVAFVGLNANQNEKADDIKADATQSFAFPMLRDEGSKVADLYGAQRTPEAFVIDPSGVIRYHGGVADLGPALAQLVAGTPIAKAESKAFGCTIKRKP